MANVKTSWLGAALVSATTILGSPAVAQQDAGVNNAPTGPVVVMPVADSLPSAQEVFKDSAPLQLAMFNGKNIGVYGGRLVSVDATLDGVNEIVKQTAETGIGAFNKDAAQITVLDPNDPAVVALLAEYRQAVADKTVAFFAADGAGAVQVDGQNLFTIETVDLAAGEQAPSGLAAIVPPANSEGNVNTISDGALQALANANAPLPLFTPVADTTNVVNQPAVPSQVTADAVPSAVVANDAAAQPAQPAPVFLDGNFDGYLVYSPSMNGGKAVVVTDADNINLSGYAIVDTTALAEITKNTDAATIFEFSYSAVTVQTIAPYPGYGQLYLNTVNDVLNTTDVTVVSVNFSGTSNIQLEDNNTYTALVRDMQVLSPDDAKVAIREIRSFISGTEFQTEQFTSLANLAAPVDNNANPAANPAPDMDNTAASAPAFVGDLDPNVSVSSNDANGGQGGWVPKSTLDVPESDPKKSFTNNHRWVDGQNGQPGGWVTDADFDKLFPGVPRRVNTPAPAAVQDATKPAAQSVTPAVDAKPADSAFPAMALADMNARFADANGAYAAYLNTALQKERSDAAAALAAQQAKTAKAEAAAAQAKADADAARAQAKAANINADTAVQTASAERARANAAEQTAAGRFGGWAVAGFATLAAVAGAVIGRISGSSKQKARIDKLEQQMANMTQAIEALTQVLKSQGIEVAQTADNGRSTTRAPAHAPAIATGVALAAAPTFGGVGQEAAQAAPVPSAQTTTAVAANGNAKSPSPFGVFIDAPNFSGELTMGADQMYRVKQYSR